MSKYWSSLVHELDPYVPGEQPKMAELIKLNTNENPYGPSPEVLRVLAEEVNSSLRLYPDPNAEMLKQAIADFYGINPSEVFVGNGSDEVLAHCFQALLKRRKPILLPDISYSFYPVYCRLFQVEYENIPLADNFELKVGDYIKENGGIIFANPNAPTGRYVEIAKIVKLLEANRNSVVVVDEAYIDFGGESAVQLIGEFDNLLVIQTMSKSRALAGLRIGFGMGNSSLIEGLERVKNSFNSYPLDRLAIQGGVAAMQDREYFRQSCDAIIATRERLKEALRDRGFEVIPSLTNFVFARNLRHDAEYLSKMLRARNILVRFFNKPRIDQFLRITVGTEEQTDLFLHALDEILTE